jgi:hypothetical protein
MVHDSIAGCPSVMGFGETLMRGALGAFTVSVTVTGVVGAGHVRVYMKEPADEGFTVIEPLAAAVPVRLPSVLLQLHVQGLGLTLA